MARRKRHCKHGFKKGTRQCRKRAVHHRRRRHMGGRKIGGDYKVACNGKRVYASSSESSAKDAARSASKRMGRCLVFTKRGRVATYSRGTAE